MGSSTTWSQSTNSPSDDNLMVTIPSHLPLSNPERSVLGKSLKFVPDSGPIDIFSVKEDTSENVSFSDEGPLLETLEFFEISHGSYQPSNFLPYLSLCTPYSILISETAERNFE